MNQFILGLLTFSSLTLIAVCGTFMLTGLTGLFSFGQGGFMAVGAYVSVISHMRYGIPFPLSVLLGVLAAMIISVILGIPTLRLRRDYFALVTFGFGEAIRAVFEVFTQFTGGTMGLGGIPRYTTLPLALGLALLSVWTVANIKRSKFGRNSIALRNDELASETVGIDVFRHKMKIFIFSAALAALSGALTAFYVNYMEPRLFGWTTSVEQIIIVFFGGINSLTGTVLSSFLISMLPEWLRFAAAWRMVIYAAIIILVINWRPQGLFGDWEISLSFFQSLMRRLGLRSASQEELASSKH